VSGIPCTLASVCLNQRGGSVFYILDGSQHEYYFLMKSRLHQCFLTLQSVQKCVILCSGRCVVWYVFVPMTFVCIHPSGRVMKLAWSKSQTRLLINFRAGKLWLRSDFIFWVYKWFPTNSFLGRLISHFENHYSRPYCLSRKVYLIILEVGVTRTHTNEMKSGKIFRNDTIYNKTAKL